MKYNVFISYSRDDLRQVEPLVKDIERRANVKCWIDWNGIESGAQFEDVIIKAINSVDVVLFFVSESSINSEYAKMEVNYAFNTKKKVVPIVLDGGQLRGWFLFKFGAIDYIDVSESRQYDKLIQNLQTWCGTTVQNEIPESKPQPESRDVFNWKRWGIAAMALLALCLGSMLLFKHCFSSHESKYEIVECSVGDVVFNMVKVPAGTFVMGGYDGDAAFHQVTISNDFLIGETEVTQDLWNAVMNENPSVTVGTKIPVNNVSWNDCIQFVRKLNDLTGEKYRMPTEAEWEYVAKFGDKEYAYSGSDLPDQVAWYIENSGSHAHEPKLKSSNELGVYDMSGNLWEWCSDHYDVYNVNDSLNPKGPRQGTKRVRRGGSYNDNPRCCLVTFRSRNSEDVRKQNQGLRLVKEIN